MEKCGVFGVIPDGACSNTFHINFHFSGNSVGHIKQSFRALFGDIRWSGEPTRRHRWRYKIAVFSEVTFIFKFEFTPWVVRSSTYFPFILLQLFWEPNPFCPLRVALVASRCVAVVVRTDALISSYQSRRVAFSVRYALNTWRVVHGLARSRRPYSRCKPSRTEPN